MTAQDKAKLADRMRQEARRDRAAKILRQLDKYQEPIADLLWRIDNDAQWFFVWGRALRFGAKCPSHEERAAIREVIRARLPDLHVLSAEDRELLAHLEAAREAACGEQWREPDLDTAEDSYDR